MKVVVADVIAPYRLHPEDLDAAADKIIDMQASIECRCAVSMTMLDSARPGRFWSFTKEYRIYNRQEEDPIATGYICPLLQICISSGTTRIMSWCELRHPVEK